MFHLDEVKHKRGFEHPVQLDVLVPQQVLQAAPRAVLRHHREHGEVGEEAQEWIHVFVSQVFHLRRQINKFMEVVTTDSSIYHLVSWT